MALASSPVATSTVRSARGTVAIGFIAATWLSEASTTSSRCDWERTPTQKGDLGSSYSIIAVPDGAWAWKQVASRVPDSVDATVGGHPARVTSTGDVYLSDGVNILHLTGQRLAGVSVVDTSLGVLSVLSPDEVAAAYQGRRLRFGPDYIIPKPFDPRDRSRFLSALDLAIVRLKRAADRNTAT